LLAVNYDKGINTEEIPARREQFGTAELEEEKPKSNSAF